MNNTLKKKLVPALLLAGCLCAAATLQAKGTASNDKPLPVYLDPTKDVEARVEDALRRMTLDEKIAVIHAQSKFSAPGVKRLGLPDFWTDDGPHGVRPDVLWDEWEQAGQTNDSCVAFPALTCLAATWNPQMGWIYGKSLGEEALYRGKDMILGPGVNIYRTPLGGRNFEYMGEDPLLAATMVVPYIQGLQSNGVAACVKHYALNNDEEYRHQVNVVVSERALHEIYLPAFKAAVQKGKVWGLMGAYNLYRNQHNCHNDYLLNQVLKRDWKFDGVVVSDCGWVTPTELNTATTVKGMQPQGMKYGEAYVIYNSAYDNEYYLLENRSNEFGDWDRSIAGSGLMIQYVDYDPKVWQYNVVNATTSSTASYLKHTYQSMTIFHADNSATHDTNSGDLYPYGSNNSLTDSSTPAATINHGGAFMGKPITNIKRNADNTIDFDFMGGSTSNIISGISVINDGVAAKSTGVYSLDGRYMGNTLEGLPHGVYITNGKKVVR